MNANPLTLLDQILSDWASPRVRRLVHGLILLVVVLVAAYFAADGDWKALLVSIAGALYAASNKANTPATDLNPADSLEGAETGSYEELGGNPYPEESPYNQMEPLWQEGSDEEGFGGDAPERVSGN